jgi:hypothetical protein
MKLTPEQKQKYIEANNANLCPFCESADISGEHIEVAGKEAWQEVSCNECGEGWRDVYALAFVETDDE